MPRPRSTERSGRGLALAILVSLVLHVPLAIWFIRATYLREPPPYTPERLEVSLQVTPPESTEPETPEREEPTGQIVEIAPPENPERPETADYLSEYDSTVDEETVDPRYRNDRVVTADRYSPDDAYDLEEIDGIENTRPSTGALSGREYFRHGNYSLFPDRPSPWDQTHREGIHAPAPSSNRQTRLAGSPSNDWLPEVERSNRTALNSHETLFASWWNRVKQLVSFYADQTLANARPRVPLRRPTYELTLSGLIAADGSLTALEVKQSSGIPEFDEAIKEAFRLAAPFPEPPDGALEPDGQVHMDQFGFVITIGAARADMSGIDPRQNVQFPGLQTVPR